MIDYIITNRNIHPSKVLDVRVLNSANTGTDHNLVLAKIRRHTQKKTNIIHGKIEKLNIEPLADDSTKHLYRQRLSQKIEESNIMAEDDVETTWAKLSSSITKAAEEALGKRQINIGNRRNTKPWFTEEIKTLATEKRKSYLQYRSRIITYDEYRIMRNRVNGEIQAIKRSFWEKFSSDMEHDLYGGQRRIWNMLRNRKKPVNEYVHTTRITTEEWERYFWERYTLYTGETPQPELENEVEESGEQQEPYIGEAPQSEPGNEIEESMEQQEQEQELLTRNKVKAAILKLKSRKAPGLDNINNVLLKYGGQALREELYALLCKIHSQRKVPIQWKESITIPVFKKGIKNDPKNYKGISLLSSTAKLLTKIISEEVAQDGISEEQQGFRQNRSTTDAIYILRQIVEKSIEYNKTAYMCFIDLTQAFDRVRLSDVLTLLRERKLDPGLLAVIKELNTGNSTFIRVENNLSKKVPVSTGIRQGDSFSPILFNIIMDEIIKVVKMVGRGYRMGEQEIKILCYADDAVIISEDEDNLQRLLFQFETAAT